MAQFEVPQFIDIESKVVGPLTLRQFAFIAAPTLVVFFLFFVLNMVVWVPVTIVLMSAGIALAFVKISGRPLYAVVLMAFSYLWKPKLFLWRRPVVEEVIEVPTTKEDIALRRNALQMAASGISHVTKLWQDIVTRKTPIPKREKTVPTRPITEMKEQYQVFKRITGEKDVARRVDYR
jgi:PrgI family protein